MNISGSYSENKRSALLIRLNYLVFISTALYAVMGKFLNVDVPFYIYLSFFLYAGVNALLIRLGLIEITKIFALLIFNIIVFIVATSEPFETGMFLQFVSAGTVAMALYGYEQWKGAITFITLSLVLDIISFTTDFSIIPWRDIDPQQARIFFLLNTVIAVIVCVYTFMMYSKINFDSEKVLRENEKLIKKQNDQLLKANNELDRFVYSASHDLRAPLSTLTGLINLSKYENNDGAKVEYLEMMQERINSMDNFISEIIDYSRNSRMELKLEKINIMELLGEVIEELKYADEANDISFKWEFNDNLEVWSDRTRLRMTFSNLISNAMKYRDSEKENSLITLKGVLQNGTTKICIEDNGIGIKKEYQNQIFDMFFRAHEKSSGSGLGLYITKETLHKLSGNIEVKSEEGIGSEFIVTLPTGNPVQHPRVN